MPPSQSPTCKGSDDGHREAHIIEPQNTYPRFITSVFDHVQQILHATIQQPVLSTNPTSGDDGGRRSPSSPTFPGAYPPEHGAFTTTNQPHIPAIPPGISPPLNSNQSFFQGASAFTINGNPRFVNIVNKNVGTAGLDALRGFVSFSALHDSSVQDPERRCHPGTRESILRQISHWIDDPDTSDPILWLYGPAGIGKSAIAQTIAQSVTREKVAGTFFFFRSDPSRNDGNRLFPTLAWQIAKSIPGVTDYIANALEQDSDIALKAIEVQFEQLITRPLLQLTKNSDGQIPPYVVVIDGVDECTDTKLQSRFLKLMGDSVDHIPLRFFISSRPEADIEDALAPYKSMMISIDLAKIDDAHRDIEKFLTAEFSRIASENQLDPLTWPGEHVIQELVLRSSGQFVYPSTVIRFVGDKYNSAASQLNVILGFNPTKGKSPFAELDALYIEILQRQPDQEFLKEFLTLLVGRSEVEGPKDLGRDDSLLLKVDNNQLHKKSRGMRSLLKFEPHIGVYHQSFLDFLQDKSRSGQYHTETYMARRRYLELITQTVIQYASKIVEQRDCDETKNFAPAFEFVMSHYPRTIQLPFRYHEEVLQPLWDFRGELLKMPRMKYNELYRKHHIFSNIIDNMLLHYQNHCVYFGSLPSLQNQLESTNWPRLSLHDVAELVAVYGGNGWRWQDPTDVSVAGWQSRAQTLIGREVPDFLSFLLANLRNTELGPSIRAIHELRGYLSLDPVEVASTIRSVTDAQDLVDLLYYVSKNKSFLDDCSPDLPCNAIKLALEIWRRIKLLPRAIILHQVDFSTRIYDHDDMNVEWRSINVGDVKTVCQSAHACAFLSHESIHPLLCVYPSGDNRMSLGLVYLSPRKDTTLFGWRRGSNPSVVAIQERMLEVAHAIQYMHSFDISYSHYKDDVYKRDVYVDSNSRAKIGVVDPIVDLRECGYGPITKQNDVLHFGRAFYEVLFDIELAIEWPNSDLASASTIADPEAFNERPLEPEIQDHTWDLIHRCCADDPGSRPTMDEIVEEMKSWKTRH